MSEEEACRRRRPHALSRASMWGTGQILISACVAHTLSFSAIGLDVFARQRPAVTPLGAVISHSPSR